MVARANRGSKRLFWNEETVIAKMPPRPQEVTTDIGGAIDGRG